MDEDLRVHIIPLGYDDIRVTWPLVKKKADIVYLINHTIDKKNKPTRYYKWIKKRLAKELPKIEIKESVADLWNLHELIDILRKIISTERKNGNKLYVNISTGSKIASIAGIFACMISDAVPYYIRLDYHNDRKKIDGLEMHEVIGDWVHPPILTIQKPSKEQMAVLTILDLNKGTMRKRDLIDRLATMKIIKSNNPENGEFSMHAKHGQLCSLLKPLENEWKYVKIDRHRSRSNVSLTTEGSNALLMFGFENS